MIHKKQENLNTHIKATKLYLEDIEFIISILDDFGLKIIISDSNAIYESLEDLIAHNGKNPKGIEIKGKSEKSLFEYIVIWISIDGTTVLAEGEELLRPAYEIEKYLRRKKRKKIYAIFNSGNAKMWILIGAVLLVASYISREFYNKKLFSIPASFFLFVFGIIILIISEFNPHSNTKIELERKHKLNYYQEHKEKIFLSIISAILGALITFLIGKL